MSIFTSKIGDKYKKKRMYDDVIHFYIAFSEFKNLYISEKFFVYFFFFLVMIIMKHTKFHSFKIKIIFQGDVNINLIFLIHIYDQNLTNTDTFASLTKSMYIL